MVGRGARDPWRYGKTDGDAAQRREVAAELIHFIHEPVRDSATRASASSKKFYSWYLVRPLPEPFKQELVPVDSTGEVVTRLLAAPRGAAPAQLEQPSARDDEILLDQLRWVYGGG